ncbi:MAG: hypothetical protein Q9181_007258 [Wetmoreana brouardii]
MSVAQQQPSCATDKDVPRDNHWVQQQSFHRLEYSAINSREGEIRLLKIKRGIFRSDVVECEFVNTFLGRGTEFDALSYCCGVAGMSDVMLCNERTHYIYPSLNAALKAFRESPLQEHLLWSDAISINQADKAELSEQILLMGRIYSEAASVFVYLGPVEPQYLQGLDFMQMLYVLQSCLDDGTISMNVVQLPSGSHPCWTEYLKTWASPWFRRTWILQEFSLAREVIVGIGRFWVVWDVFERSFRFFREQGFIEAIRSAHPGVFGGCLSFMRMLEIQRIARSPDRSSFLEILRATRHFKVSDPRDKIIGVLGMLGDLPVQLQSVSDYRLSTAQIYHRAAVYLIRNHFSIAVLEHAGLQRRIGILHANNVLVYDDIEEAFARTLMIDDLYSDSNAIRAMTTIENRS